jgi:hypothetical protein
LGGDYGDYGDYGEWRRYYPLCITRIKVGDSIVNVGSGTSLKFEQAVKLHFPEIDPFSLDKNLVDSPASHHYQFEIGTDVLPELLLGRFTKVFCFEVIEHVRDMDELVAILKSLLKVSDDARIYISFPNLASLMCRIELLLGFQPHVLEVSKISSTFGTGKFGKFNSPGGKSIGHINGITVAAMIDMAKSSGLTLTNSWGFMNSLKRWPKRFVSFGGTAVLEFGLSNIR